MALAKQNIDDDKKISNKSVSTKTGSRTIQVRTNTDDTNLSGIDSIQSARGTPKTIQSSGPTGLNTDASNLAGTNNVRIAGGSPRTTTPRNSTITDSTYTRGQDNAMNLSGVDRIQSSAGISNNTNQRSSSIDTRTNNFTPITTNKTLNRSNFDNDNNYERYLVENKVNLSDTNSDAFKYIREKADESGTTARNYSMQMVQNYRDKFTTENFQQKYNNGELSNEQANYINDYTAVIDNNNNRIDTDSYINDTNLYKQTSEKINEEVESLNKKYTEGKIDYSKYQAEYGNIQRRWQENELLGERLRNYKVLQGFDYYDWARANNQDVSDFEKMMGALDDNAIERIGNLYGASLIDSANILPQTYELLKTIDRKYGAVNGEGGFNFTDEDTISSKLTNQANELRRYAMAGTDGFENWSLQTLSSIMPTINSMITGTVLGEIAGLSGQALTKAVDIFSRTSLGLQSAGQVTRHRIEEGSGLIPAVLNGSFHGSISFIVEGLDTEKVASLFTGEAGKFLLSNALLSKADMIDIAKFLNAVAFPEMIEEGVEYLADQVADRTQNLFAQSIEGKVNVETASPQELANQLVMAYAGAILMGAPTAVNVTIDSRRKYNGAIESRKYFESVLSSELSSPEEKAMSQKAIEAINHDIANYTNISVLDDAVELPSDRVDSNGTYDEVMNNLANAVRQDVQEELQTARETLNRAQQLENDFQNALLNKGINMSSQDYLNLNDVAKENFKNISNFFNDNGIDNAFVNLMSGQNGVITKDGSIILNTDQTKTIDLDNFADLTDQDFKKAIKNNSNENQIFDEAGAQESVVTTASHELAHYAEKSGQWNKLRNIVKESMGTERFNKAVERLQELYNSRGITDVNPESEAVAFYIQKNLGNIDFLERLSSYNNNLFNRLYENVRALFSGDEQVQLENAFERAFRDAQNKQSEQSQTKGFISDTDNDRFYTLENLNKIEPRKMLVVDEISPYDESVNLFEKAIESIENTEGSRVEQGRDGIKHYLTNDFTKKEGFFSNNSIDSINNNEPGSTITKANIGELFKTAIPLNKTEYVGDKAYRKGQKYTILFNEISDGNKTYLVRFVIQDENPQSVDFERRLHRYRTDVTSDIEDGDANSVDINIQETSNIKEGPDNLGESQATVPSYTFSIDKLLHDVNDSKWQEELPNEIIRKFNGHDRIESEKGKDFRKFYSLGEQNVNNEANNPANYFKYSFGEKGDNSTKDSGGEQVSDKDRQYFKGTRLTDGNGNLLRIYHTSSSAFTEFNPTGRIGYRFGDKIVNYFSTDEDVSGSYTDDDYSQIKTAEDFDAIEADAEKWHNLQKQINQLEKDSVKYQADKSEEISKIIMSEPFWNALKEVKKNLDNFNKREPIILYDGVYPLSNELIVDNFSKHISRIMDEAMISDPYVAPSIISFYDNIADGNYMGYYQMSPDFVELFEPIYKFDEDINTIRNIRDDIENKNEEIEKQKEKLAIEQEKYQNAYGKQYVGYGKSKNPYILNTPEYARINWDEINGLEYTIPVEMFNSITNDIVNTISMAYDDDIKDLKTINRINRYVLNNVSEDVKNFLLESPITLANVSQIIASEKSSYDNYSDPKVLADEIGRSLQMQGQYNQWSNGKTKFNRRLETNDVVRAVLAINDYTNAPYDGVIFRGITDSGSETAMGIPSDIIALFDSNQFKLIGNENPTTSPDMRYSLGENKNNVDTQNSVSPEIQVGLDANQEAIEKYGAYGLGNNPVRNVEIARQTDAGPTSRFWNNLANSKYVSDEEAQRIQSIVGNGLGAYERRSNKQQRTEARRMLREMGLEDSFKYAMNTDNVSTADVDTVFCKELLSEMRLKGLSNTENYHQLEARIAWRSTMIGRAEQAFNTFRTQTPEGQVVTIRSEIERIQQGLNERYGENAYDVKLDESLIDEYLRARTDEEREEIRIELAKGVAKQIPPTALEQLNSFRHLSMLFNPRTWIKNNLANRAMGYINEGTRAVRSVLESIAYEKGKNNENSVFYGMERQAGTYNPFSQKEREQFTKFKEQYNTKFKDKIDMKYSAIDAGNILLGTGFGEEVSRYRDAFTSNFLNKLSNINAKMMSDAPGMSTAYAKSMVGYLKANGLDYDSMTPEQIEKAQDFAINEAKYATFNSYNKLASDIAQFSSDGGIARRVIVESFLPFKRTPLNLLKTGFRYTPVGLAETMTNGFAQLKQGKMTANQWINNVAQGMTGSALMALGALLAHMGIFRTKDDDKDRKQYYDQDLGEQEYSLNWDGGSYTIDWLDPMIVPLAMGAELVKYVQSGEYSLDEMINLISSLADPMFETSMLSGIQKNLSNYSSGTTQWWGKIAQNAVTNYIQQYIPSVLGATARTIDDTRRSTYTDKGALAKAYKQALNKIPGLSTLNEPYINRKGQVEKNQGNNIIDRAILNFLSPGYYASKDIDEYDEEMYRLYEQTGDINSLPSSTNNSLKYEGENYKFTPEQYTQWQTTRWQTESEYVNQFMDSQAYQQLSDEERVATIKDIRDYAQKVAKQQFLASQGIDYEDKTLNNAQGAMDYGIELYAYYDYLNNAGSKQADKIKYLENSNLTQAQKEYLWGLSDYKSSYQDAYEKVFGKEEESTNKSSKKKSSSKKRGSGSSGVEKVSPGAITGKSGGSPGSVSGGSVSRAGRVNMVGKGNADNVKKEEADIVNSYLKAYSSSMRNSSKASSGSTGGTVVCPRCGNKVSSASGRCPICGAKL